MRRAAAGLTLGTCLLVHVACNEESPPGWTTAPGEAETGTSDEPLRATSTDTGSTSGEAARCGDGVLDPGEGCDDGNTAPDDGCDATCTPVATIEWTYTHNGGAGADDSAAGVAIDATGRVFVVGSEVLQSRDALILALAPEGHELWRRTIDAAGLDDAFVDVAVDGDGRVFAAGHEELAPGSEAAVVRAFTADGELLWKFSEPGSGLAGISGLVRVEGALVSTGSEESPQGVVSLVVRGHDVTTGAATWKTVTQGGAASARGGGIAAAGGQLIAAGHAEVAGSIHPLLARLDAAGALLSTAIEHEHRGLWTDAAALGGEGDVVLSGRLERAGGDFDVAVRRIAADGAVRWTQTVDHREGLDVGRAVAVGAGEAVFVAGEVTGTSGDLEIFGGRFTGAGERRWTHVHANPGPGLDDHGAAAAFGPGFIVLAGDAAVPGEGGNVWVRRFRSE